MKKGYKLQRITQNKIIGILKRNDVVKAGFFGSYARGDAKKKRYRPFNKIQR